MTTFSGYLITIGGQCKTGAPKRVTKISLAANFAAGVFFQCELHPKTPKSLTPVMYSRTLSPLSGRDNSVVEMKE